MKGHRSRLEGDQCKAGQKRQCTKVACGLEAGKGTFGALSTRAKQGGKLMDHICIISQAWRMCALCAACRPSNPAACPLKSRPHRLRLRGRRRKGGQGSLRGCIALSVLDCQRPHIRLSWRLGCWGPSSSCTALGTCHLYRTDRSMHIADEQSKEPATQDASVPG